MSSRYKDSATAEFVIGEAIADNKKSIDDWLKDTKAKATEEFKSPEYDKPIGEGVPKGSETAQDINQAIVVLKKDPTAPGGYIVLTSFPKP